MPDVVSRKMMRMRLDGGMELIHGFSRPDIDRMTRLQKRRVITIAIGRALRHKADGHHNTAHNWFSIAVRVFTAAQQAQHAR
jgi:hypothetical protein